MPKRSAGLLMYRFTGQELQVLLVHPGGPFWAKKHIGAWSIPKGEYGDTELPLEAAKREFNEETGLQPTEPFLELGSVQQAGGKRVTAWAFEGDCDPAKIAGNLCRMEWPARSGRWIEFPEVDRAQWFSLEEAKLHLLKSQLPLLESLANHPVLKL